MKKSWRKNLQCKKAAVTPSKKPTRGLAKRLPRLRVTAKGGARAEG